MKIKRYIVLCILGLTVLAASAQKQDKKMIVEKTVQQQAGFSAGFDLSSNVLNTSMLSKIVFGGTLNNAYEPSWKKSNIAGMNADFSARYQQSRPNRHLRYWGWQASLESHRTVELAFTPDLYRFLLNGNAGFAGKTADISGSYYRELQYYQLKGGVFVKAAEKAAGYGAGLSLNMMNNARLMDIPSGGIYTSSNGDSLALAGDISGYYQDTGQVGFWAVNGIGAGIDLWYEYRNQQLFDVRAEVRNLGFVYAGDNYDFRLEEAVVWQGFEVPNILNMGSELDRFSARDSLNQFIMANSRPAKRYIFTPADMQLQLKRIIKQDRTEAELFFRYRLFSLYRPMIMARFNFLINKDLKLSPNLSYGGYSGFNMGMGFDWSFKKHFRLRAETRYLSGMILQNNFSGMGGFINFTCQF